MLRAACSSHRLPLTHSVLRDEVVCFRALQAITIDGDECQPWGLQLPHGHPYTPARFPSAGLEQNYCRNPDYDRSPWCYTSQMGTRWQFCDICDRTPPAPSSPPRLPPAAPAVDTDINWWECIHSGSLGCTLLKGVERVWAKLQDVQGLIIAIGAIADTCPGLNEGRGGVLGRLDDAGRAAGAAGADGTMMDVLAGISEGDAGSPEVPGADGKLAPNPGT